VVDHMIDPDTRQGQPRTNKRQCGIQSAYQSLITDVFRSRSLLCTYWQVWRTFQSCPRCLTKDWPAAPQDGLRRVASLPLRVDQWCTTNAVCIAELDAGGSVISVPPKPSEVALKLAAVYCPSRVSVSTAAPLLTVSVPLALAPEVSCVHDRLVVPLV
jgi:hypothetical protein